MVTHTQKLPVEGPRQYTLRDAYRGRIWRSPIVVLSRELLGWSVAATLFGFLMEHGGLFSVGALSSILSVVFMLAGSIITNQRRVHIIRKGPSATGTINAVSRIILLHELLRGEREKTFVIKFHFDDANGRRHRGRVWVCGCARDYFLPLSTSPIVYDLKKPTNALPLRLAVMVAPH